MLKRLLEESIELFGTRDIVTIMLSQRLDKEIVEEQKKLMKGVGSNV